MSHLVAPGSHRVAGPRRRGTRALLGTLLLTFALVLVVDRPADAAPQLQVSPTSELDPDGQTVTVTGSGFDTSKGIYVAFCITPAAGQVPSPCGGGVDTDGSSGGSVWISDDPPPYGEGLAQPFDEGGRFSVTIDVAPMIGDIDCRIADCSVVTRADHLRTSDRSQDVAVPVSFAAPAPEEPVEPPEPASAEPTPDDGGSAAPAERADEHGTGPPSADEDADPDAGLAVEEADGGEQGTGKGLDRRRAGDHEVAGDVGAQLRGADDPPAPERSPEASAGSSRARDLTTPERDEQGAIAATDTPPSSRPVVFGVVVLALVAVAVFAVSWRRIARTGSGRDAEIERTARHVAPGGGHA